MVPVRLFYTQPPTFMPPNRKTAVPRNIDLEKHISRLRNRLPGADAPKHGDLWFVLPDHAPGHYYDDDTGRQIPNSAGIVFQDELGRRLFHKTGSESASAPWIKFYVDTKGAVTRRPHFRPALVLGGHLQQRTRRAAIMPGFSEPYKGGLPQLHLDYRHSALHSDLGRDHAYYGYYAAWTADLDDFLAPLGTIQDALLYNRDLHATEDALTYAIALLASILTRTTSSPALWRYHTATKRRPTARYLRHRELVAAQFARGGPWIPCVVVSHDHYNAQQANRVIVLRSIRLEDPNDAEDEFIVPLRADDVRLLGIDELDDADWAVDISLLRGIPADYARDTALKVILAEDEPQWLQIHSGLRECYSNA